MRTRCLLKKEEKKLLCTIPEFFCPEKANATNKIEIKRKEKQQNSQKEEMLAEVQFTTGGGHR